MKRKYAILFSLSGLILCLDQLTKGLVQGSLALGQTLSIIPNAFSIVHARNTGFVFGYLQRGPSSLQDIFFIGIPIFALVLIVLIFIKLQDNQMLTSVALTTILAGAIGNLIDRIHYGYVIDFLSIGWKTSFRLPPFNIADFSIIIGVGLMFYSTLFSARSKDGIS